MPYFRALLSALTYFGGHVLNRRLDRVIAVFAALSALAIASYVLLPTFATALDSAAALRWTLKTPALLAVAIALVSAVLTWMDARLPSATALGTGTRAAGAIVSVFGLTILVLSIGSLGVLRGTVSSPDSSTSLPSTADTTTVVHYLHASTHLGGHPRTPNLTRPPAGPHELRGRIVLDGKPAENVQVEVVLNEAFEVQDLFTDARGEFATPLTPGKWRINRVTVTGWDDAPPGRELLLFSEYEPRKTSAYYQRLDYNDDTGVEIALPAAPAMIPTFELRDAIKVQWPSRTSLFGRVDGHPVVPVGDAATSAISWSPIESAVEYEVQVSSITRKDRMTSFHTILRRRTNESSLPLATLPQQPAQSPDANEYGVSIFAFDADGRLLTESSEYSEEFAFSLADSARLAEEPQVHENSPTTAPTEYFKNLERLSLVSGLLEYKQIDAARAILRDVTEDSPPGRKEAMLGAIEALAGNCKAAVPLLDKADAQGGAGCAPSKYRKLCEGK